MLTSPATTNWFHVVEIVGFWRRSELSRVCGSAVKMRGAHSASRKTLEGHSEVSVFSLTHLLFLVSDASDSCNYQFSDF